MFTYVGFAGLEQFYNLCLRYPDGFIFQAYFYLDGFVRLMLFFLYCAAKIENGDGLCKGMGCFQVRVSYYKQIIY